ncbi:nucleotide exchange factor GrpE [Patescibacteria group bacterium]|nr:nucleotide exchange factor GrpE [Patescibacteria group bacterium]
MSKKDTEKKEQLDDIDIEFEETEYEGVSQKDKNKKLRDELTEAKKQSQEYLTGWQKERASFANYKSDEEKKRKERIEGLKLNLIADFFPVLDSFDMAFSNKEAWEKVDPAWRTGVEYIYTQFMNTLDSYGVSVIDQTDVPFDPNIHEPVERVRVDTEDQHDTIVKVIQKGYRAGDIVLRPAKVNVGNYEN